MNIDVFADELCVFFMNLKEVQNASIYGSLQSNDTDEYSDIDIELDVSGIDNGKFLLSIPAIVATKYAVIFFDYAPSLAPEQYIVTLAVNKQNPFMLIDICCAAKPHQTTVTKQDLRKANSNYNHILKLFVANLKHFLKGLNCFGDIQKMYLRICEDKCDNSQEMLDAVFRWLKKYSKENYDEYLTSLEKYLYWRV